VTIAEMLILNANGVANLVSVTDTTLNILSGTIQSIRTYSSFIMTLLNSNSVFSNLNFAEFYPILIYSSFSSLVVSNCSFSDSFEKLGDFEVSAIYLEYNISFLISNCKFDSLRNDFVGSVNI